jgi:hypothetical protein
MEAAAEALERKSSPVAADCRLAVDAMTGRAESSAAALPGLLAELPGGGGRVPVIHIWNHDRSIWSHANASAAKRNFAAGLGFVDLGDLDSAKELFEGARKTAAKPGFPWWGGSGKLAVAVRIKTAQTDLASPRIWQATLPSMGQDPQTRRSSDNLGRSVTIEAVAATRRAPHQGYEQAPRADTLRLLQRWTIENNRSLVASVLDLAPEQA